MKTLVLRSLLPVSAVSEPLDADVNYAREIELLARLKAVQRRIELTIRATDLRLHVQPGDIEGRGGERRQITAQQLVKIDAELADARPTETESKIEAALRIGEGEFKEPLAPGDALARLRQQEAVLFTAVNEQHEKVDALVGRLSHECAIANRSDHQRLLCTIYDRASAFAASLDDERRFRADLLSRGYRPTPEILPEPPLRSAAILGSESNPNSELVRWRQALEAAGVLR
jgi:hypothetical protein